MLYSVDMSNIHDTEIADVMLANWTFDGAMTPNRVMLIAALAELPVE